MRRGKLIVVASAVLLFTVVCARIVAVIARDSYTPNRFPEPERTNQIMVRAVADGDIGAVRQFLANGASPNTIFKYLDEPVESTGFAPKSIWNRLTRSGPQPCIRNGPTALMKAVLNRDIEMARVLLTYGADPNVKGSYDQDPLGEAMLSKNRAMAVLLRRSGAQ